MFLEIQSVVLALHLKPMLLLDHSDRRMRCWTSTRWFMTKALIWWNSPPTSHRRLGLQTPKLELLETGVHVLNYFIDLLWTQVTPAKKSKHVLTSALHLSPLPAAPPCCRFSALGDASWNTQAHKSPVGHIYIKVETWLETPPLPIFLV